MDARRSRTHKTTCIVGKGGRGKGAVTAGERSEAEDGGREAGGGKRQGDRGAEGKGTGGHGRAGGVMGSCEQAYKVARPLAAAAAAASTQVPVPTSAAPASAATAEHGQPMAKRRKVEGAKQPKADDRTKQGAEEVQNNAHKRSTRPTAAAAATAQTQKPVPASAAPASAAAAALGEPPSKRTKAPSLQ